MASVTPTPDSQTAHGLVSAMSRKQRRRAIAGAGTLMMVLLAAWPLLTYIGIPEARYATAPDSCELVGDATARELIGPTWYIIDRGDSNNYPQGSAVGLKYKHRLRTCLIRGPLADDGSLYVWSHWYSNTQLNLGPSGAARAARVSKSSQEEFRELSQADCSHELHGPRGNVCGIRDRHPPSFSLHIQRENLYIWVSFNPPSRSELSDHWLDQRMAQVTEDVLARLDDAP